MARDKDEDNEKDSEEELKDSELPDESDVKESQESGTYRCPYCGKEVYEDAIRCPSCHRYVSAEHAKGRHGLQWVVLAVILALAALGIWALVK